jgi:hypothetical protein
MGTELETTTTPNYDRLQDIDECGRMFQKGYNYREIADLKSIDPRTARAYVEEYDAHLNQMAKDDPYFLDKIQINTLRALGELNEVSKETWESVELATRDGMISARIQALRLGLDTAKAKAQIHQLMGTAGAGDGELIARMQRQESVNNILSRVVSEVVADCDSCRTLARSKLKEAFAILDSGDFETPEQVIASVDFDYNAESEEA